MIANKHGVARLTAGVALAMGMAFAAPPANAEPLPHNFLQLKLHYLQCFGLMFSNPAQHDAECGTGAPSSFGQNDGDTAGPGGGGYECRPYQGGNQIQSQDICLD
ncbi:MAG TPA: hypothetical protein VIL84_15210 [Devosiaceae bacterium]